MKKVDLHIHSTASDGKFTPEQIVALAKVKDIYYISITDHNTIDGVEKGLEEGKKIGVKVIPGIELSTRFKGRQVHILGYFNKEIYKNKKFIKAITFIQKKNVYQLKSIFKDKIKVRKGQKRLELSEGIKFLKMFGAKVVLAHPGKIKRENLNDIINHDFDGIEAIHPRHNKAEIEYFKNIAKSKGMFYTAGTDFHNIVKKNVKHGILGELFLEVKDINDILKF